MLLSKNRKKLPKITQRYKHDSRKYECYHGDFQANPLRSLNIHIKRVGEQTWVRFINKCDQCEKQNIGYDGLKSLQKPSKVVGHPIFKGFHNQISDSKVTAVLPHSVT